MYIPTPPAVIPAVAGPMQALLAILPGLVVAFMATLAALFKPSTMKKGALLLWRVKLTLIPVVAVIVALFWIVPGLLSRHYAGDMIEVDYDWPTFGRDMRRQGAIPDAVGPLQGGIVWANDDSPAFVSTPAVVGGRVYAVSGEVGIIRREGTGFVYCFDARTGEIVWRTRPDGMRATFSSPAVVGDRLVVGEGLHTTSDARLFVLDISPEGRGRLLWKYQVGGYLESSPTVVDGRIYIGAGSGGFGEAGMGDGYYCFELEPDDEGNPQLVWHVPADRYPGAETPPAVHDGKVFIAMGYGGIPGVGYGVACLDAETGEEIWRLDTPYPVRSAPTIYNGRVYFGMGLADYVNTGAAARESYTSRLQAEGVSQEETDIARARFLQPDGEVWAVNMEDPDERWEYKVGGSVLGAVTAAEEGIYFGSWDGFVYLLSHEGDELVSWNAHAPVLTSPAYTDTHIYIVNNQGRLYALTRHDLQPVWETTLGGGLPFASSPIVAHGHVYVGTPRDGFLCVGEPVDVTDPPVPFWKGNASAAQYAEPLPDVGHRVWDWPETEFGEADAPSITAMAAWTEEQFLVPVADGKHAGLTALVMEEDDPDPREAWHFETALGVHQAPAAGDGKAYFVDGRRGDKGRNLYCVSLEDGRELWRAAIETDAAGVMALFRDGIAIQDRPGHLTWFALDGNIMWSELMDAEVSYPLDRRIDILVALAQEPDSLIAMDAPSGRILWREELDSSPTDRPVIDGRIIYVPTEAGLHVHCLVNGSHQRRAGEKGAAGAPVIHGAFVAYVNTDSELEILNREDGAPVVQLGDAIAVQPIWFRGAVLYAADEGVKIYRPGRDDGPRLWLDTEWLGRISSPPMLIGPNLFVATEQYGFICAGEW